MPCPDQAVSSLLQANSWLLTHPLLAMNTPGSLSLLPVTSEPGNTSSAWPPDAVLGNVSAASSAAGLAVSGILIPLVYLVVCVVGLLGNSLVIYVVLRQTATPSVTNVYILNLALADELFMLGLPFLAAQAQLFAGADFLLAAWREEDTLHGMELLGNAHAAPGILRALGCENGVFQIPGGEKPFAMICKFTKTAGTPAYFGFSFD